MTMRKNKIKKCPICENFYLLKIAIKNHIYGRSQNEAYRVMRNIVNNNTPIPITKLKKLMSHFYYVIKYTQGKTSAYLKI